MSEAGSIGGVKFVIPILKLPLLIIFFNEFGQGLHSVSPEEVYNDLCKRKKMLGRKGKIVLWF